MQDIYTLRKGDPGDYMFESIRNHHSLLSRLGLFVSLNGVRDNERNLKSEEEINELDRYELAREFLEQEGPSQQGHSVEFFGVPFDELEATDFYDDIAIWIDKKLIEKYVQFSGNHIQAQEDTELIYHFRENEMVRFNPEQDENWTPRASRKQVGYLTGLLKKADLYCVYPLENLTIEQASSLIQYLSQDQEIDVETKELIKPLPDECGDRGVR